MPVCQELPGGGTWLTFHSISPPLVFGPPTKDQRAHQVHPHPTSPERTPVFSYDWNEIIQTASGWNPTSFTTLLGWYTRDRHQHSSLCSRLASSYIYNPQKCLCLMWNVPSPSIQSIWLQDQWAHLSSPWQWVGTTTRDGSRVLLGRQEDMGSHLPTLLRRDLDLWRMP